MNLVNIGKYSPEKKKHIYLFSYSFVESYDDQKKIFYGEINYKSVKLNRSDLIERHLTSLFLYQEALKNLTSYLNQWNRVQFSLSYWHIALGPWLGKIIVLFVDRWIKFKKFTDPNQQYQCEINSNNFLKDLNYFEQSENGNFVNYNTFFSSIVLKSLKFENWELIKVDERFCYRAKAYSARLQEIENFKIDGFTKWETKILSLLLKKSKIPFSNFNFNFKPTSLSSEISGRINFYDFIRELLPTDIIQSELFKENIYSSPPSRKIVLGTHGGGDLARNISLANKLEKGRNDLVIQQHGSIYGDVLISTTNYLKEYSLNKFISWGFVGHPMHPTRSIVPAPSPMMAKMRLRRILAKKNKKIIFATSILAPNHGNATSTQHCDQVDLYFQFAYKLMFQIVKSQINSDFYYRPRQTHNEYAFQVTKALLEKLPTIKTITVPHIEKEIASAQLVIVDNAGSILHKSLAANIPVMMLWPVDAILFIEKLNPVFAVFKEEKVLFHDPLELFTHLEDIQKNIEAWWQRPKIQWARKKFISTLCPADFFYFFKWIIAMRKL